MRLLRSIGRGASTARVWARRQTVAGEYGQWTEGTVCLMTDAFPIVSVGNLDAVVKFYARLGFSATYQFPADGQPEFVTIERNGSTIGVAARHETQPERFSYWVYVDDVDALFATLTGAGAEVVSEPRNEPWGERVASVRDPDGNVVHIGAAVAPAE